VNAKAALLGDLARQMARQEADRPLPLRLCGAATDLLGASGSALTVAYTTPDRVTLCSTTDEAARLEDLQEVLGQGPGPLAYDTRLHVHAVLDEVADARWPAFSAAVNDLFGVVQMHAFPLVLDHDVLGVLTCHLPPATELLLPLEDAQFVANAVGIALLHDPDARRTPHDMHSGRSWSSRAAIHQATGMVVAQLHVRPDDALVLLRAHAFAQGTDLESVAQAVLARELDFRSDDNRRGRP